MLKVLIVDDEYMVLKGLEAMITAQKDFPVQVEIASDAAEALEKLKKQVPDVIIADINMPEMDGLQMLQIARERSSRCRFIVCTGYDEIEYLHRAIRQQVEEYLLKPIDRKVLLGKLREIELQKKNESSEALSLLKMNLLYRQTDAPLPGVEELRALFPEEEYRLCIIPNEGSAAQEDLCSIFSPFFPQVMVLHRSRNTVLLIAAPPSLSLRTVRGICRSLLADRQMRWGCSSPLPLSDDCKKIDCRYFYEALSDLILSGLPVSEEEHEEIQCAALRPVWLWNAEENEEKERLLCLLQQLTAALSSPELAFAQMYADFSASIYDPSSSLPDSLHWAEEYRSCLTETHNWNGVYRAVVQLFGHEIPGLCGREASDENTDKINRAAAYIRRNYQEDISLDSVAGYVSLHPSYLSYLFKKKTGESFLHFLHTVRLQAACRLMQEKPEFPLEKISEMVGYRTSTYFYKTFRQRFGTSPRDWQKGPDLK